MSFIKYVIGNNSPGYLPDNAPIAFDDWNDALASLSDEVVSYYDDNFDNLGSESPELPYEKEVVLSILKNWPTGQDIEITPRDGVVCFFLTRQVVVPDNIKFGPPRYMMGGEEVSREAWLAAKV